MGMKHTWNLLQPAEAKCVKEQYIKMKYQEDSLLAGDGEPPQIVLKAIENVPTPATAKALIPIDPAPQQQIVFEVVPVVPKSMLWIHRTIMFSY